MKAYSVLRACARLIVHVCIVGMAICVSPRTASAAPGAWDCYYAWADTSAWEKFQAAKTKTPCCAREPEIFADSLPSVGVDHDAAVVAFWVTFYQLAAHDPSYRGRHVVTGPKCIAKVVP